MRIGHQERAAAQADLLRHYEAGRLDQGEFEARRERIGSAIDQRQLDGVFVDLPALPDAAGVTATGVPAYSPRPAAYADPQPHDTLDSPRGGAQVTQGPQPGRPSAPTPDGTVDSPAAVGNQVKEGGFLVPIAVIVSLVLFFTTDGIWDDNWLAFLLIPASVGAWRLARGTHEADRRGGFVILTVMTALALFTTLGDYMRHAWLFFLLIPLASMVPLGGSSSTRSVRSEMRRERRQALRAERRDRRQ